MIKKIVILLLILNLIMLFSIDAKCSIGANYRMEIEGEYLWRGIIFTGLALWGFGQREKTDYIKWSSGIFLTIGMANLITVRF